MSRTKEKYEVHPGISVGPFEIGLPVSEVIQIVEKKQAQIPQVEFKYANGNPQKHDLIMKLKHIGMIMKFDGASQRLKLIDIYDFTKIELSYSGKEFSSLEKRTFWNLYNRVFGPYYPGTYDSKIERYLLSYPGICLAFPIPDQFKDLYTKKGSRVELPLEFPDGTTPVCERILVFSGEELEKALAKPQLPLKKHPHLRLSYELVHVEMKKGVTFDSLKASVLFGSSGQDLFACLGHPDSVHFKNESSTIIGASPSNKLEKYDYNLNYIKLGMDFTFDGIEHKLKRITMHTNVPGHIDFGVYHKCNFKIILRNDFDISELVGQSYDSITPETKWDEVENLMGKPLGDPVLYNKGSSQNPFGPCQFFGYPNLIFEITDSGDIASVTVFPDF